MGALLGALAAELAKAILNPSPAGLTLSAEEIQVWLGRLSGAINTVLQAIAWVMGQELGSVQYSNQYCTQIGKDFETIEGLQEARWRALFERIMPNSLAHLNGYIFSTGIVPLRNDVAELHTQVDALVKDTNSLLEWRANVAQPAIDDYKNFRATFDRDYLPAINVLRDWLEHPDHFGTWAAAPVIGPIVAYLADDAHKQTRDNLTDVLAQAWAETPDKVWGDFENMLVS